MKRISLFGVLTCVYLLLSACQLDAAERFEEVRRYKCPEAHQGVAVDKTHFYAISNRVIAKYDKESGTRLAVWEATDERPLVHLNAGVVIDGKLYCAHSTYPHIPTTNSVEIWNTETLEHIASHSFGIGEGALTWVDRRDGKWWAVFAYYSNRSGDTEHGKDNRWTSLVQYDGEWRKLQSWRFPSSVLERFSPNSNSGGAWGPKGLLYCSGHDQEELYVLRLPKASSTLVHLKTISAPITGQAFAWDKSQHGRLYGISRRTREVVVSQFADR